MRMPAGAGEITARSAAGEGGNLASSLRVAAQVRPFTPAPRSGPRSSRGRSPGRRMRRHVPARPQRERGSGTRVVGEVDARSAAGEGEISPRASAWQRKYAPSPLPLSHKGRGVQALASSERSTRAARRVRGEISPRASAWPRKYAPSPLPLVPARAPRAGARRAAACDGMSRRSHKGRGVQALASSERSPRATRRGQSGRASQPRSSPLPWWERSTRAARRVRGEISPRASAWQRKYAPSPLPLVPARAPRAGARRAAACGGMYQLTGKGEGDPRRGSRR